MWKATFVFPFKSAKRRKSPPDREEDATSPSQTSSCWRFWSFRRIWKTETDVCSGTFLPETSGSIQKQAEAPSSASPLSSRPHTSTLSFFGHKAGEANVQQPFPQWHTLQRPITLLNNNNNKKKDMLSLTEDGKPGGTFRTFFVWMSNRKKKRKQWNTWGRLPGPALLFPLEKELLVRFLWI